MLYFPDQTKPYYLQTDASDYAIGAVLYQLDLDSVKIIACGSRTLRVAERAYFTTEKELLALVWALQKYHGFLWGARIIHRTDHMALSFLQSCKLISKRLTRWIMAIQDYQITVEHCPGKENVIADAISRQTTQTLGSDNTGDGNIIKLNHLAKRPGKSIRNHLTNLLEEQKKDPKLNPIRNDIANHPNHRLIHDLLYKKHQETWRIHLPITIVEELIANCHEIYGHVGARKCHHMLSEDFYHPGLLTQIRKQLRSCDVCQRHKIPTQSSFTPSRAIILSRPMEAVFIDFYGPLPTAKYGYKYILGVLDGFSKYVKLYPLRRQTTLATINKLFSDYFPNYGIPERIVTDHGTQFTTKSWIDKLKKAGIEHTLTSIRHPQSNMVERVNRELSKFFRILLKEFRHSSWYDKVKIIENILNEAHHDTTELTPMELMLKKKPIRFWKMWLPTTSQNQESTYVQKLVRAKNRIREKGLKRANKTDMNKKMENYQQGDKVLVKAYNLSDKSLKRTAKFMAVFEGPYIIGKIIREGTYVIEHPKRRRERGIFHASDLRRYQDR